MFIVNENAACVLVALIAATALCAVYGMFLLLSKSGRILAAYAVKAYARGRSAKKKMEGSGVSVAPVTLIPVLLPPTVWDNPSDQP